jgi:hypothetical protein
MNNIRKATETCVVTELLGDITFAADILVIALSYYDAAAKLCSENVTVSESDYTSGRHISLMTSDYQESDSQLFSCNSVSKNKRINENVDSGASMRQCD